MLEKLGDRIHALRERRGMTQEAFANKCGISVSFASLLERWQRSPSYETLVHVADALEMPIAELFRDVGNAAEDAPYLGKLLDFARNAKLTRAQVDKLIQVGTAIFDIAERQAESGRMRTQGVVCSVERCGRPVLARGLCASHYHRQRRARSREG